MIEWVKLNFAICVIREEMLVMMTMILSLNTSSLFGKLTRKWSRHLTFFAARSDQVLTVPTGKCYPYSSKRLIVCVHVLVSLRSTCLLLRPCDVVVCHVRVMPMVLYGVFFFCFFFYPIFYLRTSVSLPP